MRRVVIAAVAASVALLVSGCSGDEPDGPNDAGAGSGSGSSAGGGAQEVSGNHVEALDGSTLTFGEPIEYDDGLTVVVSEPTSFDPSAGAVTGAEKHVQVTVRLVNGSKKRVSPADVFITVESGGGQGGDVLDPAQSMSGPPAKAIKPGGKASWVQGFGVVDPEDVSVVVQTGLTRAPVELHASGTE